MKRLKEMWENFKHTNALTEISGGKKQKRAEKYVKTHR